MGSNVVPCKLSIFAPKKQIKLKQSKIFPVIPLMKKIAVDTQYTENA